eukprot:336862_1
MAPECRYVFCVILLTIILQLQQITADDDDHVIYMIPKDCRSGIVWICNLNGIDCIHAQEYALGDCGDSCDLGCGDHCLECFNGVCTDSPGCIIYPDIETMHGSVWDSKQEKTISKPLIELFSYSNRFIARRKLHKMYDRLNKKSVESNEVYVCDENQNCNVICSNDKIDTICIEKSIYCPMDTYSCTVICKGNDVCTDTMIHCPMDSICNIECDGKNACNGTSILWSPNVGFDSNLVCKSDDACVNVNFPEIKMMEDYKELKVDCDLENNCSWKIINCPQNAGCHVRCYGDNACIQTQYNWIEHQPYSFVMESERDSKQEL